MTIDEQRYMEVVPHALRDIAEKMDLLKPRLIAIDDKLAINPNDIVAVKREGEKIATIDMRNGVTYTVEFTEPKANLEEILKWLKMN